MLGQMANRRTDPMLRTWTDTHYQLNDRDWLYIATHEELGSASLVCPGYTRDGTGFSIHFTAAHTETLEKLIAVLKILKAQPQPLSTYPEPEKTVSVIR
jgi:hypothetical protein